MEGEPHQLTEPDTSLGELVGRLTNELGDLFRTHVDLAKTEVKEELKRTGQGAGLIAAGAAAALVAAIVLSLAAGWGLAELMPPGVAFLLVGVVWAALTLTLVLIGRGRLRAMQPGRQTMEELEEDREWLKRQAG